MNQCSIFRGIDRFSYRIYTVKLIIVKNSLKYCVKIPIKSFIKQIQLYKFVKNQSIGY